MEESLAINPPFLQGRELLESVDVLPRLQVLQEGRPVLRLAVADEALPGPPPPFLQVALDLQVLLVEIPHGEGRVQDQEPLLLEDADQLLALLLFALVLMEEDVLVQTQVLVYLASPLLHQVVAVGVEVDQQFVAYLQESLVLEKHQQLLILFYAEFAQDPHSVVRDFSPGAGQVPEHLLFPLDELVVVVDVGVKRCPIPDQTVRQVYLLDRTVEIFHNSALGRSLVLILFHNHFQVVLKPFLVRSDWLELQFSQFFEVGGHKARAVVLFAEVHAHLVHELHVLLQQVELQLVAFPLGDDALDVNGLIGGYKLAIVENHKSHHSFLMAKVANKLQSN